MNTGYYTGSISGRMGNPSDSQLALINKRLEKSLTAEEVFVFPAVASNRSYDSYHSRMDDSSLKNYAKDYKDGRSFMNGHRTGERPTGRTFDATFDSKTGEVTAWTYVLRDIKINDTANNDFIRAVEGGTIQDVSIRFSGGSEICELCDKRLSSKACTHVPGVEYEIGDENKLATYRIDDAHASELSDVYKGSTPRAGIIRKARQMHERGLFSEKELRRVAERYGLETRAILGEEYLLFDWEKEGLDDNDGPDGDQPTDPNPVTNMDRPQKVGDNKAKTGGQLDGRSVNLEKAELDALVKIYSRQIEEHAIDLEPEYIRSVQDALKKWRAGEDAEPPMQKKKKKPDDEVKDEPDTEPKTETPRFLKPKNREMSFDTFIRALGGASGNEKLPLPMGGDFEPGKGHDAGMLMEGLDQPLANVASSVFQEVNSGTEVPGDDSIIKGAQELNYTALLISPSGAMFLMNGGGTVSNGVGVGVGDGLYVPMGRSEGEPLKEFIPKIDYDGKEVYRYEPVVIRLDKTDNIRALVNAAIDGGRYRRQLTQDLVRYGLMTHGKRFDVETHKELASSMSTERLEKFTENYRVQAAEHYRTHPVEDKKASDFDSVNVLSRQTTVRGNAPNEEFSDKRHHDPLDNPALYRS